MRRNSLQKLLCVAICTVTMMSQCIPALMAQSCLDMFLLTCWHCNPASQCPEVYDDTYLDMDVVGNIACGYDSSSDPCDSGGLCYVFHFQAYGSCNGQFKIEQAALCCLP